MAGKKKFKTETQVTKLTWVGHKHIPTVDKQLVVTKYSGALFTRRVMQSIIDKKNKALIDAGFRGKIAINVLYPHGWFAGTVQQISLNAHIPKYEDYDDPNIDPNFYQAFTVAYIPDPPDRGGASLERQHSDR